MRLSADRTIRVASGPSGHVYVRHLTHPCVSDNVRRLDDPTPAGEVTVAGQWWPPAMLSQDWVRSHHTEFDIFHVQFGFDALDVEHLTALVETLRELGKPLVYTVHDLRNPHHLLPGEHEAHLDGLIPASDALAPGCASCRQARERRSPHHRPRGRRSPDPREEQWRIPDR